MAASGAERAWYVASRRGGRRAPRVSWGSPERRVRSDPPRYTDAPRGCGGIGRRARFRSVWAQARGGSSPLIRIGLVAHPQRPAPLAPAARGTIIRAERDVEIRENRRQAAARGAAGARGA